MTGQSIPDNQMALSYDDGIDTATVTKTRRAALLASNFGKTLDVSPAPYPPRNPPLLIRNMTRRRNLLMIF